MATLDDIWDEPAEATPARPRPTPRTDDDEEGAIAPSRRRQALFLDSDDDEPSPSARKPTAAPDLDDVFAGLGDDDDDGPTPQTPARGARASSPFTPHAVLPSSSPPRDWKDGGAAAPAEGAPKKRVQAKLDEARLLGSDGFPALLKQTRGFVPKGKGHEVRAPWRVRMLLQLTRRCSPQQADLNRLMSLYQFWAHRMYPKTQFRDTVKTVEKLCHSKRMHVSLCPLPPPRRRA
jgi:replication fork protection complex subunit Csm3/Swi3